MNVCAICAHTDDAELHCGGTLAKYSKRGDTVTIIDFFDGSWGFPQGEKPIDDLLEVRKKEGNLAAGIINAERVFLGVADGGLEITRDDKMALIEAVRHAQPDVILTHHPEDQNPDHRIMSQLARDVSFWARAAKTPTANPPVKRIVPVFYFDTAAGVNFQPVQYVDIRDTIDVKLQMCKVYESQLDFLAKSKGDHSASAADYLRGIEEAARYRGHQAECNYAEGFVPLVTSSGVPPVNLLPQ